MPPRNSNTKAFKRYERIPSVADPRFTMETVYKNILNPEDAIGNKYSKQFEAFKKKSEDDGINIETEFQKNIKDDMDGDERYIRKEWYVKKIRG